MKQVPLLFLSDSPDLPTGLGRITRDLALHIARDLPQYRVGTYGRAGNGSRSLPWAQYQFSPTLDDQWGTRQLASVWKDFAGDDPGVMMTIQDASRMYWFGQPDKDTELGQILTSGKVLRWGYVPVDSTGPNNQLSGVCKAALRGYDRVLAYTKFGADVLSRSLGLPVDWIPHGIYSGVFQPRDRKRARDVMGFPTDAFVVGVNMTNQPRKDWGLAFTIASFLRDKNPNFRLWAHVDVLDRYWSIPALIEDFGLENVVKMTLVGDLDDESLSYFYSACDVTMLPSLGEGFGYPIVESLACNVPCIHGDYAGGAEALPAAWKPTPKAWRLDTPYNCLRPVFDPLEWAKTIQSSASLQRPSELVQHLDWESLWTSCWRKWFAEALA